MLVAGYLSDKVKFRYLFTVSFLLRAIGFFGFTHIDDPEDSGAQALCFIGFFGN